MKEFPELTDKIIKHIDRSLDSLSGPAIAAFDADGTLWSADVGGVLFEYQIAQDLIPDLPPNPWQYYDNMKYDANREKVFPEAFLWLAQINAGQTLQTVRNWACEALETVADFSTFSEQKEIIDHLHKKGVEIFIVTTSVKWSVEPVAEFCNIDKDHVIGVATEVVGDVITDKPDGPVTYKQGKVEGLLHDTKGVKPFFCSGNTEADLPLIEAATDIKVVVSSVSRNHENYATEQVMQKMAFQNGWYSLDYLETGGTFNRYEYNCS